MWLFLCSPSIQEPLSQFVDFSQGELFCVLSLNRCVHKGKEISGFLFAILLMSQIIFYVWDILKIQASYRHTQIKIIKIIEEEFNKLFYLQKYRWVKVWGMVLNHRVKKKEL